MADKLITDFFFHPNYIAFPPHFKQAKKLKIEKIQLKESLEDLEGKANLCEVNNSEILIKI